MSAILDDPILLGEHAERMLRDEVFLKAMGDLEATYITKWRMAKTVEARESAFASITAVGDLQVELQKMVGAKTFAKARQKTFKIDKPS